MWSNLELNKFLTNLFLLSYEYKYNLSTFQLKLINYKY